MSQSRIAATRGADQRLEDVIRLSPVDLEQASVHRRIVPSACVTPWLWCVAMPWLSGSTFRRFFAQRNER